MGRGPTCHESNPCYERTVGSTGINDEADPHSPVLLPQNRRPSGPGASHEEIAEIQRTLNKLSKANQGALAQISLQLRSPKDLSAEKLRDLRRAQKLVITNRDLIAAARKVATGHPRALSEIISVLGNRSHPPYNRLIAALLLARIGSPKSLEALAGRVTDPADSDTVRFNCAIYLSTSTSPLALPLVLMAINHPSTWEEFDENEELRASLTEKGVPTNLRFLLIDAIDGTTEGEAELERRLRTPLIFQEGWLATILWFWLPTQENYWRESSTEYIEIAADVLRLRTAPNKLRCDAALALYTMRKEIKDRGDFPRAAWDALHSVYKEQSSGRLRDIVEMTLKMQGNAPRQ